MGMWVGFNLKENRENYNAGDTLLGLESQLFYFLKEVIQTLGFSVKLICKMRLIIVSISQGF